MLGVYNMYGCCYDRILLVHGSTCPLVLKNHESISIFASFTNIKAIIQLGFNDTVL